MVYRRSRTNIRKPIRRRATARRTYKRTSVRRRPSGRRSMCKPCGIRELTPAARFALAQLDPFEPRAVGAKVPDTNTMPSLANCDTDIVAFNAPIAAGNLVAAAYAPGYSSSITASNDVSPFAVTWPSTATASRRNKANVVAAIEAIRPVAHAVRISSGLAPTAATGFVHIGISVESRVNTAVSLNFEYPTSVNQMSGLAFYKRVTLASLTQSPLTVINKWIDETGFRYEDPRSSYDTAVGGGTPQLTDFKFQQSWGVIIIMVDGQTSTTVSPLSVEHILHTEGLPKKDAFILGTPAAPSSPGIMSAVSSMAGDTDFAHTEAQQDTYVNQGLNVLQRGAAAAGERVFEVLSPIAQHVGARVGDAAATYALNSVMGYGGIGGVNNQPMRLAL